MLRRGFLFEFEIPSGWKEEREENRYIYRGAVGEELIISGTLIEGVGSEDELRAHRNYLLGNAVEAAQAAASHPELKITRPLGRVEISPGIECWTLDAQTKAGDTIFLEAIALDHSGLLLITFEAPNMPRCSEEYATFLKSIRRTTLNNPYQV